MNTARLPLLRRIEHSAYVFPVALFAALLMVVISETGYSDTRATLDELIEVGRARVQVHTVLRRASDAESGQRGYLLTGRKEYLEPYNEASADLGELLVQLHAHYEKWPDSSAQALLQDLDGAVRNKLSEMTEVIRLQDSGRPEDARDLILTDIGRNQMEQVRRRAEQLIAAENRKVTIGLAKVNRSLLFNLVGVTGMTLLCLLALWMFLRQTRALAVQRIEQQQQLEVERDGLEAQVLQRTEQLTELAAHLQTAREDERYRLARELHDELGALLTAAKLDAARIRPKLAAAAPESLERLTHLTDALNSGIALKRRIIEDLRPSSLTNLGLVSALEIHAREFSERLEVPVRTDLETLRLSPSAELTAYRLVQEAFTNIAKYAGATEVAVRLVAEGPWALIEVRDNGIGFDASARPASTHGLLGMRYRVEAEGGELQVQSRRGEGTTLSARLPLLPAAADQAVAA